MTNLYVVMFGTEEVSQHETRKDAEMHCQNLNAAYQTNSYRVEVECC